MTHGITVEFDVPATMTDGTTLRANIYRPARDGPWPTLLTRTPYGKDDPETHLWLDPVLAAHRGFLVVVQDTRGRFASDGEWIPFEFEPSDGHDSVEWAARLSGSNGRVGMYGCSYVGNTQWLAAAQQPPSLAAISPGLTWCDPLDGLLSRGGALELGLVLPWTLGTSADRINRLGTSPEGLDALIDEFDALAEDGYWKLPVGRDMLGDPSAADIGTLTMLDDPGISARSRVRTTMVKSPSFHLGGWYDCFLQGSLDAYTAMARSGHSARLVVGPWAHSLPNKPVTGELAFGLRSARLGIAAHASGDTNDLLLDWMDEQLGGGGTHDNRTHSAPVRIFVMGRNEWRDEPEWPLTRARLCAAYLHSEGELSSEQPSEQPPSQFACDPMKPVPTVGGHTLLTPEFPPGPFDQRAIEGREDVLVFTSAELRHDVEVTGHVRAILHGQSSLEAVDWVVRLCDVHPGGQSYNICDGVARFDSGGTQLQRIVVDLWSTSNVFLAGHRIRVHVTCSSFPRWARNLGTGRHRHSATARGTQQIFHTVEAASWVELPIVDAQNPFEL